MYNTLYIINLFVYFKTHYSILIITTTDCFTYHNSFKILIYKAQLKLSMNAENFKVKNYKSLKVF